MIRSRRRTIRQLVVRHIIAFGLLSLLLEGGAFLISRRLVAASIDANMQARFDQLAHVTRAQGLMASVAKIDRLTSEGGQFGYELTTASGERLKSTGIVGLPAPGWGMTSFPDPDDGRTEQGRTLTGLLPGGARLTILSDMDRVDSFDTAAIAFLSLSLGALLLVALLGSLSMEAAVAGRLRAFSATADAIMTGSLDQRVPLSRFGDEFDTVATTINSMLDRIGELFGDVRRLSGYVAHDLRMPLVRVSGFLREQSGRCQTAETCSASLAHAAQECDRLIELVGSILQLGQVDRFEVLARGVVFDLSEMVRDLGEAHRAVAEASGRSLSLSIEDKIFVLGMRDLLAHAMVNLIDNAIEHTVPGSAIRVELSSEDNLIHLIVSDDNPLRDGEAQTFLSEDRQSRRLDADQGRKALGLKMVRAIALAHGGKLRLADRKPGLDVDIQLPEPASPAQC